MIDPSTLVPVGNPGAFTPLAVDRERVLSGEFSKDFGTLFSAANDKHWLGSLLLGMEADQAPSEPGFNPVPLIPKKFEAHSPYLGASSSRQMFDQRLALVERQSRNSEAMSERPGLALLAGAHTALDPTNYIGGGWVLRAPSIASGIARGLLQGSAIGAAQSAIGYAYDPSGEMSDIIAQTLTSGLFNAGGAGLALTGKSGRTIQVNKAAGYRSSFNLMREHEGLVYPDAIPVVKEGERRSAGAAANSLLPDEPKDPEGPVQTIKGRFSSLGIENWKISPMIRAVTSGIESVSQFAQEMAPIPFFLNKHGEGAVGPISAKTEAAIRYNALGVDLINTFDRSYYKYFGEQKDPNFFRNVKLAAQNFYDGVGGGEKKMTPEQFRIEVTGQVASRTFDHAVPEVNEAAKTAAKVYDIIGAEVEKSGIFGPDFKAGAPRVWHLNNGDTITEHYFGPGIWNLALLRADKEGFMRDWENWQALLPKDHEHLKLTAEQAFKAVSRDRRYIPIDDDMTGLASGLRARELRVPYKVFGKWMLQDAENLNRFYVRTVGLDLELAKRSRMKIVSDGVEGLTPPDVSMRPRINAAKEDFTQKFDDALLLKGVAGKTVGDRVIGPARQAVISMHSAEAAARREGQRLYADVMGILEGKANHEPSNEAIALHAKISKEADPELALETSLRLRFEESQKSILDSGKKALGDLAEANGISRKDAEDLFEKMQAAGRDMADMRDAIRGTLGQPDDPMGFTPKATRIIKQITNITTMSGFVAALSDTGNIAIAHGVTRTFGALFEDLGRRMQGLLPAVNKKELNAALVATEMQTNGRAAIMSDMTDVHGRYTPFERTVDTMQNAFFVLSGITPWTDFVQGVSGTLIIGKVMDAAEKLKAGGKLTKSETMNFARAGLDEPMLRRIAEQPGSVRDARGLWAIDSTTWEPDVSLRLRAAIHDDVRRLVVESNRIEQPVLISGPIGSMLAQYKGFGISVTNRLLIPLLQQKDVRTLSGVMMVIAAGYMADEIRAWQSGRDISQDSMVTRIGRAIERSGLSGYLTDIGRSMDSLTNGHFGYGALIGDAGGASPLGVLGPGVSLAARLANVSAGYTIEPWSQDHARDLRGLMPFNKVGHLMWMFNGLEQAIGPGTLAVPRR